MKLGGFVVLLFAASLGGCAAGGGGTNPNLLAPKLVVEPRADGNLSIFVHGAFREQVYDWIRVDVDNVTVSNRSSVFSSEEHANASGFFVTIESHAGNQLYQTKARVDHDAKQHRLVVSFLETDGWVDARAYNLPFEHIMDRPKVSS